MKDISKLDKWYQEISSIEKLKIDEAKELYKKAKMSSDVNTKKIFIDKIILGTLYVVCDYIKRNDIEMFYSSSFDMDDIISSFNEVWINKIYNGDLLRVDSFSNIFTTSFFSEVYKNLCNDEIVIKEQFGIPIECLTDLLSIYIYFKNSGKDFNKNDFISKYREYNSWFGYSNLDIENVIPLLDKIYINLNVRNECTLNMARTKIYEFIRVIINIGMFDRLNNSFYDEVNYEDKVLEKIYNEKFIKDVDSVLIDERKKSIIHERFGLDSGEPETLEMVGKRHSLTKSRVGQIEAKSLRYLRRSEKIRNYVRTGDFYNEKI